MGKFFKPRKEPQLTAADRERIARMSGGEFAESRKVKFELILGKDDLVAEVLIAIYGEDDADCRKQADEIIMFFRTADKTWTERSFRKIERPAPFQRKED